MKQALAALALCALADGALAAAADGSFAVEGPGSQSCAEFTRALGADEQSAVVAYAAWTEGFMTGFNVFRDETFDITPWQTTPLVIAKMRTFCEQNPEMPYVNGLGRLIATLMPQRQTEPSEMVQARNDGRAVVLPASVLARVRDALEEATGETIATPSGSFDEDFAAVIETFQQGADLTQSGLPDQATLNALFP